MAAIDKELAKALAAAKKGDAKKALVPLLTAWELERAPELDAAITAADATLAGAKPFEGDTDDWVKAAKLAAPHERGPLLAALKGPKLADTQRRLEAAAKWKSDPRTSRALETLLREVPYSSDSSKPAWRAAFALVESLKDPRFIALQKELPPQWQVRALIRTWLVSQFENVVEDLEPAKALSDAQRKTCEEIRAALAGAAPKPKPGAKDPEALLAEIYANPRDDAPRLVYADWLQEQGDPRGEFIALQFKADKTSADLKREKALLKQHARKWLGPLEPVLLKEGVEYRRGFAAKGGVKFRHQADAKKYGALREWGTLEELTWSHPNPIPVGQETGCRFIGPAFHGLKIARGPWVAFVLGAPSPWTIEALDANFDDIEEFLHVFESDRLPSLTHVGLGNYDGLDWFRSVRSFGKVTSMRVNRGRNMVADWLALAQKTQLTAFLFEHHSAGSMRFSRDAAGDFSQLECDFADPRMATGDIDSIPAGWITRWQSVGKITPELTQKLDSKMRSQGTPRAKLAIGAGDGLSQERAHALAIDAQGMVLVAQSSRLSRVEPKTGRVLADVAVNLHQLSAFSPGARWAALARWRRADVYDCEAMKRIARLSGDFTQPRQLSLDASGTRLLLVSTNALVLFDVRLQLPLLQLETRGSAGVLLDDGFISAHGNRVRLHDDAGKVRRELELTGQTHVLALARVGGGFAVASRGGKIDDGRVSLFGADGSAGPTVQAHWPNVWSSDDGNTLVVLSQTRLLNLDARSLAQRWESTWHGQPLGLSFDGQQLFGWKDGLVEVGAVKVPA